MHAGYLSAFAAVNAFDEDPLEPDPDGLLEPPQAASRTAAKTMRAVSEGRCVRRCARMREV
jgi:hypothetical protein